MKTKTVKAISIAILAMMCSSSMCLAAIVSITVNDGGSSSYYGSPDPRPGIGEIGQVKKDCVAEKRWDNFGFWYDDSNNSLILATGFDVINGNVDGNGVRNIGDILIDLDGFVKTPSRPTPADGAYDYPNPGFEACINFQGSSDGRTLNYSMVDLSENSTVRTGIYGQNGDADPCSMVGSAVDVVLSTDLKALVQVMTNGELRSKLGIDVGNNEGPNYVVTIPLGTFDNMFENKTATFWFNEDCSNDPTEGVKSFSTSPIPEPGSLSAVALLLSLGAFFRKR